MYRVTSSYVVQKMLERPLRVMSIKIFLTEAMCNFFAWFRTPRLKEWLWNLPDSILNTWKNRLAALKWELTANVLPQETSDFEEAQMGKELACVKQIVEVLKEELETSLSREKISELEKEQMEKNLASALENIKSLKIELRTAIARQKTSEFEKEQAERNLAAAVKNIKTLESELRTSTSQKETADLEEAQMGEKLARIRHLEHLIQLNESTISDLERQREKTYINLSKKDEVIKRLEMELLNAQTTCTKDAGLIDAAVIHDEAEAKGAVSCHESTNQVESNVQEWELSEWEESSPIQDQPGMTAELCEAEAKGAVLCHESTNQIESNEQEWEISEWEQSSPIQDQPGMTAELCEAEAKGAVLCHESTNQIESNDQEWELSEWEESSPFQYQPGMTAKLCGEICSILCQLRRGSFETSLTKILLLPLTSGNIEAFAYSIYKMAINYPDLSEVFAHLSDAMFHKLPEKVGTKMRNFLVGRCKNTFMEPVDYPDYRPILRDLDNATNAREKISFQGIYYVDQRERETFINNTRFIGELWKAGIMQTEQIHTVILELIHNREQLSMRSLYSLLKATGKDLEERNEDLSQYFDSIQDICKTADNLSTLVKMDLEDLVELRQKQWKGEIY
jgi:hypothetical protein